MELQHLSFDAWVKYVFDHPTEGLEWYFQADALWWNETKNPDLTIQYLTSLFEDAPHYCSPYSDAQLKQGFWFLVSNACSSHMFSLMDNRVPLEDRLHCVRSFYTLYEEFFSVKCSPHLSHLDEPGANEINVTVYMWWDLIPIYGQPDDRSRKQIDETILDVMSQTLNLPSDACRESALHGLGHWNLYYPQFVARCIDDFLKREQTLRPELRTYALNARAGCIQ